MKTKERFEKVVEYQYPDGSCFDGFWLGFYFMSFFMYIIYIVFSPFTFNKSEFCGHRKVYFIKSKIEGEKQK